MRDEFHVRLLWLTSQLAAGSSFCA